MQQSQLPGILCDRQIRLLCEVPVAEIQFADMRVRGVSNNVYVPVFANELADLHATAKRLGPIYAGEGTRVEMIDVFDNGWIEREKALFKPMIEPFYPDQCNRIIKQLNEEDQAFVIELQKRNLEVFEFDRVMRQKFQSYAGLRSEHDIPIAVIEKCISFGLSSYGYDVRCADEFLVFHNLNSTMVDPKNFDDNSFKRVKGDYCIVPPNSFVLAHTVEKFNIPRDVVVNCLGKSTIARSGLSILVTPLEPEWSGTLTLEFANTTSLPVKLYANEGCGQLQFFRGSTPCEVSYKDRGGKYQDQPHQVVPPKV